MKRFFLKKAAALAVLLAAAVAMFPAFAEVDITPTSDFYVYDGADVLSESTESDIVSKNDILYNASGAQIVVVTVQSTGRMTTEEYAYELANSWGIGSASQNNGVLLLLSIGDEDYQCIQGSGLESSLPTSTLSRILSESLEPDFAVGDYDAGVQKTFTALYNEVCAIYGVTGSTGTVQGGRGRGRTAAATARRERRLWRGYPCGPACVPGGGNCADWRGVQCGAPTAALYLRPLLPPRPRRRFSHRHVCGQRFARLAPQAASAPAKASTRPV